MSSVTPPLVSLLQSAVAAYRAKDWQACITACDKTLKLAPIQPDALHLRAVSLGHLAYIEAAEEAFTLAAKHNPNRHEVYNNHGNFLRRIGQPHRAVTLLKQAIAMKPDFADAYESLARAHMDCQHPGEAELAYRDCLALAPNHSAARTGLGALLNGQGRSDEAEIELRQELRLRPNNAIAHNNIGHALKTQGRLNEALEAHLQAVKIAPDNAEIVANLARAYQRLGKMQEATSTYEHALQLDPANSDTHRDYNRLVWERGGTQHFLTSIDVALAVVPRQSREQLLFAKADMAGLAGRFDEAVSALDEIILTNRSNANALGRRADILTLTQRPQQAEIDYQNALRLQPESIGLAHGYASFLLSQSRFDEAKKTLSNRDPGDRLQKHIALNALALRGAGDEAYQYWYDYDRVTTVREVVVPPAYASMTSFMEAVEEALEPLFETKSAPLDQTLFNGVQSPGHLWDFQNPVLQDLKLALFKVACEFVAQLPDDSMHPFFQRRPDPSHVKEHLKFSSAWSVKLTNGGGHVDHIHPAGWISSAHYVRVPKSIPGQGENGRGGWLRLGASGVRGLEMPAERYIRPEPGTLILFPSYMWHGVEPFTDEGPRITTPFDLVPIH